MRDLVQLSDTVFAEIVHRGLSVVDINEMLLLFGAFFAKLWVQLVALKRCDTFFVELQDFFFAVSDLLKAGLD